MASLSDSQCHCLQKRNAELLCICSPGKVTVRDPFVEGGGGLVGDPNDRTVGGAEALPRPVLGLRLHVGSDALHLGWRSCRTASLTFTKPKQSSPNRTIVTLFFLKIHKIRTFCQLSIVTAVCDKAAECPAAPVIWPYDHKLAIRTQVEKTKRQVEGTGEHDATCMMPVSVVTRVKQSC